MRIRNKLVRGLFAMTLIGTMGVATFADTTEQKILTRQAAVKKAMDMSIQLKTYSTQLDATTETMKKKMEDYQTFKAYEYEDMRIDMRQQEQQRDYLKDQIEFDVNSNYSDVILLRQEIMLLDQKIALANKELNQAGIKKRNGILDEVSYQKLTINLSNMKNQKSSKELQLKEAQQKFSLLTNFDITQYELEREITYVPYTINSPIEFYVSSKVNEMIQYNEEAAEHYDATKLDRMLIGDGPIYLVPDKEATLQSNATVSSKYSTVEQMRSSYQTSLMGIYTELERNVKQLEEYKEQYGVKEKELKVMEIKYNAGLISAYDYEKAQCDFAEFKFNILQTTNRCVQLQTSLLKPWV